MDNKNSTLSHPKVQKICQLLELPSVIISEGGSINGVTKRWGDLKNIGSFSGGSVVKNIPALQETRVQSLEKDMATRSSILA